MLTFDYKLSDDMILKIEPCLQTLFDVPVCEGNSYSVLNREDFYIEDALVNKGKGRNIGIDVTLEKYLNRGYYYMFTGSLFDSRYCGGNGVWHDTKFNRKYIFNLLGGKEWMMGRSKQNILSVNAKLTLQGGDRYSPIDEAATLEHPDKEVQYDETKAYSKQLAPIFLTNISVSYKMNKKKCTHEFAVKLLIEPKYRIVRHLLLISILAVTALNQSFMTLRTGIEALGYWIFLQAFFLFTTYLIVCYFNLWVLLPRYLLKKRYVRYTLYLSAAIFLLVVVQTMEERTVLLHLNLLDEFYTPPRIFITILSSFALVSLCVSGGAMTVVLKRWMTDNQKVNQLEKLHIQSEVEQLKEQVSPHFLFNILNRTGILAKHQPEKASDMLIRLSQLLRYQLYDCNRENVHLSFKVWQNELAFQCKNSKPATKPREDKAKTGGLGLKNIMRRLELLYPDRYTLNIEENNSSYTVNLHLTL